jgi:hypothetical protein
MGLQKSKTVESGASGSYWKSCQENVDKRALTMHVELLCFISKELADSGATPLCSESFDFKLTSEELGGDRSALAYNKIKASDAWFSDAENA